MTRNAIIAERRVTEHDVHVPKPLALEAVRNAPVTRAPSTMEHARRCVPDQDRGLFMTSLLSAARECRARW